jgi:hypothetical protein
MGEKMKRILLITLLLLSSAAYTGEDEQLEIAKLKIRIERLERLVSYLLKDRQQDHHRIPNRHPLIIRPDGCNTTQRIERKQYKVTLHDGTMFLIYKWDRRSYKKRDPKGKLYYEKKYIMYDVFGKKRIWSCDKVDSIELMEEED